MTPHDDYTAGEMTARERWQLAGVLLFSLSIPTLIAFLSYFGVP